MKLKVMTYNIASGREHGTNPDVRNVIPMADAVKQHGRVQRAAKEHCSAAGEGSGSEGKTGNGTWYPGWTFADRDPALNS